MSYQSVSNVTGEQLVVHGGFKGELARVVKKCWTTGSTASKDDVLNRLTTHPYLVFDDQLAGQQAKRTEFYKKAKALFASLEKDFATGSVILTGHNNGTDKIDSSKPSRKILLRRVAPEILLLQIERHPYRGAGFHVNQFWLYDATTKVCELIGNQTIIVPKLGPTLVQKNGVWGQPTSLREEFNELIMSLLGECGLAALQSKTAFQPDHLLNPSQIIVNECESRLGRAIEQPKATKTQNTKAAAGGAISLNMTQGIIFHGIPADFFLYKLEECFNDIGANAVLDKSCRTVRVSGSPLKQVLEITFGKENKLEITCGAEKKSAELISKRRRPSFETEYSLSIQIADTEYSLSELIELFS